MKIGTALYGNNGHQIQYLLEDHPLAELVAVACIDPAHLTLNQRLNPNIRHYDTLQDLLADQAVQIVSLCSPFRKDQAKEAIQCLNAGKHVYAEKPCALNEEELDGIMLAAQSSGCHFHEMAGTAFEQPYLSMRRMIEEGTIGEIVQVYAQKSYPYHDQRPQNEDLDGGLVSQAGIHAIRFIEHVALQRIKSITAVETQLGNPSLNGGLQMAAALMMRLENGGVASVVVNYLNPKGFGRWGNEHLRIFGTLGFIEATDGGTKTRVVLGDKDLGEIDQSEPGQNYFNLFLEELTGDGNMPIPLEDELHPTRMVIRAKQNLMF